ncbi:hypothetical protein [Mucisphaera calidilacus]|uniref:Uncharacterized protein n=1 Tax=Mucisphaera calidilacus TaxID=2527982 RepID=A0A518BVD5_9BACT|nr:hypothetical protein [Mucisphaera calidilacus]QDU70936.1 hypothetical protein Pan265_07800 [Mucisphaera calidilacus]
MLGVLLCGLIGSAAWADRASVGVEGYGFGLTIERLGASVSPLERELSGSFAGFVHAVDQAEVLLGRGDVEAAVRVCLLAVDDVVAHRRSVLNAMWRGQEDLAEQIAWARRRLAQALDTDVAPDLSGLTHEDQDLLDGIARRIMDEQDTARRARLVAHYRSVRELAEVRLLSLRMTPDQRRVWVNVVSVLERAALVHEQLVMATEMLFARFETTQRRLRDNLELIRTVEGAQQLMEMFDDGSDGPMRGLQDTLRRLQQQADRFTEAAEVAIEGEALELEQRLDDAEALDTDERGRLVDEATDPELLLRMERLREESR